MTNAADLTGEWRGHYEQDGRHAIAMQVEQRGRIFVGWMRDSDTLTLGTARTYDIDEDEDAPIATGECDVAFALPEISVIEGVVEGRRVRFLKRYQGTHTISALTAADLPPIAIEDHRVVYEGELDAAGATITGQWTVPAPYGLPATTGSFELRRAPADGDQPTP